MARLMIHLLGPLEVHLDAQPLSGFETVKVQALLAFLAAEAARPQSRDFLAGLLWPGWPQNAANKNLRQTLYSLRRNIHDNQETAFLHISRSSLQFNLDSSTWVDAQVFEKALANGTELQAAVDRYRGGFLEKFSLSDSPEYEDWILSKREYYNQKMLEALRRLVTHFEQIGEYEQGLVYARKQLLIEPWLEAAYRQVMRLLALTGRRSESLAQFETIRRILRDELKVEPTRETLDLVEKIRKGEVGKASDGGGGMKTPAGKPDEINRDEISQLPAGTVTFLFTGIEGSSRLWEQHPDWMAKNLPVYNLALGEAIQTHGGIVFKTVSDAIQAAFPTALQALNAATAGQRILQDTVWDGHGELKVRMGLHTGEAELDPNGDEYVASHTKNRAARIMSAAHGGQVLLSQETADLVRRILPEGVILVDLGEYSLKGMIYPERLFQVSAPGLPDNFPALNIGSIPRHNLPLELTNFIGRQREIIQLQELVRERRLVTLIGSGGVGKTRLSVHSAGGLLAEFPDGIWFVELAPISDPDLIPQSVAVILGLHIEPGRPVLEILRHFLQQRKLLLILDNCEHLLDACARLVDSLLRTTIELKVLTSSREALGIAGEYTFHVPTLRVPESSERVRLESLQEFESVRLFVDRVKTVLPSFQLAEHNVQPVIRICQRLEGIPLALELAAARLNILTPEQLASRLDNVFRMLSGGSRTALPRQQTLRAAIDWSFQLLSAPEQILLRRLAVFAGGCTLEAVEGICTGDGVDGELILDLLSGLVNKSMLIAEQKQPREIRYRLLETVRQYALEKLFEAGESDFIHDRHLDYYLALAQSTEPQFKTSAALEGLQMLYREVDNLRNALSWAFNETGKLRINTGLRLASALLDFWHTQSFHNEGYTWLKKGLSISTSEQPDVNLRARACFAAGHLIFPLGRLDEARNWVEESLALSQKGENVPGIVMATSILGEIEARRDNFDQAKELGEASLALCRSLGDAWLLAWALCRLGTSFFYLGEIALAQPLIEESLGIFERLGDPLQVGDHFLMLGVISHLEDDPERARLFLNKALETARAMQSNWMEANVLFRLGVWAYDQRDYSQLQEYNQKCVHLMRKIGHASFVGSLFMLGLAEVNLGQTKQALGSFKECLQITEDRGVIAVSLVEIARIAQQTNQNLLAARLFGACQNLADEGLVSYHFKDEYASARNDFKPQFGDPVFEQGLAEGQALSLQQARAMALEVNHG